jgi:hypothetical protein
MQIREKRPNKISNFIGFKVILKNRKHILFDKIFSSLLNFIK